MRLYLTKPLVFFDLETTGTNIAKDRIVEISFLKIMPDGTEENRTRKLNPQTHIPEQATAVHGITDEDVKDCPTFRDIAKSLASQLEDCDLAGFNSNRFDIPLLAEEFMRAGVSIDLSRSRFIDVQTIFHKMERRTLAAAYRFYCGKELSGAHQAANDTRATYEVLMSQLDRYPELENDVAALSKFTATSSNVDLAGKIVYNENGEAVINFGKYRGELARDVLQYDEDYYMWIMQGDFPQNTRQKLAEIYKLLNGGKET